jgi:micrococcal nuclease
MALVLAGWLVVVAPPSAGAACDAGDLETGTVAAVIDGETLRLTDGRTVRLIGAKAPAPPLGWRGDDPWPFVEEAKAALERLAMAKPVELSFEGRRSDRHGHLLAQVFVVAGGERVWLQQAMIAKGLARVYSFPDHRACAAVLLAREREARSKRFGLWSSSAYRIVQATDLERLGRLIHTYQLVEGEVVAVGEGGRADLSQFRAGLAARFHRQRRAQGGERFCRRRHRSRGSRGQALARAGDAAWRNGPMIEANHPEQIELLPEEAQPKTGPAIAL